MRKLALLCCVLALPLLAQNSLVDQAKAAIKNNDSEKAAELLEQAIKQNPKNAEAHFLLGNAYGDMTQKASMFGKASLAGKTKDEFEEAVRLDPNLLDARTGLVQFYTMAPGIMGGSFDKAFEQANEIAKRDPLRGHRMRAFIYTHQDKKDLARAEYLAETKEYPSSARAHLDLGVFYLTEKNWAAAETEYQAAAKLEPNNMQPVFRLGQLAAQSGANLPRGEAQLRKYLTYTPKEDELPTARAHYWLGLIYEKQGKKAEAKASYTAALKLNPLQKDAAEALKRVS
jgi:tetratricopeptide (TPR) repeat protein